MLVKYVYNIFKSYLWDWKGFFWIFCKFFCKKIFEFFENKIKFRFGWVGLRINRLIIKVMIIWLNDEFSLI